MFLQKHLSAFEWPGQVQVLLEHFVAMQTIQSGVLVLLPQYLLHLLSSSGSRPEFLGSGRRKGKVHHTGADLVPARPVSRGLFLPQGLRQRLLALPMATACK